MRTLVNSTFAMPQSSRSAGPALRSAPLEVDPENPGPDRRFLVPPLGRRLLYFASLKIVASK
jgi:hypothetical protein